MALTDRSWVALSPWLVSLAMELGIEISLSATGWSASVVKLGITASLDGGAMFDAILYADVIGRSHSGGSVMPPDFLAIVGVVPLFFRSAINLLIL